jgi:hypothetical protein
VIDTYGNRVSPVVARGYSLVWESSEPTIATVDSTGTVNAVEVGTSLISVSGTFGGSGTISSDALIAVNQPLLAGDKRFRIQAMRGLGGETANIADIAPIQIAARSWISKTPVERSGKVSNSRPDANGLIRFATDSGVPICAASRAVSTRAHAAAS